jgi:hypothetical protein
LDRRLHSCAQVCNNERGRCTQAATTMRYGSTEWIV